MIEKEEKSIIEIKIDSAKSLTINNQSDYEQAVKMIGELKELKKSLDARHLPVKEKAYAAYKAAQQNVKDYEEPIKQAENIIRKSMSQYVAKQEAERREKERLLREQAEAEAREKAKKELEECGLTEHEAAEEAEKIEVETVSIKLEDTTKIDNVSYRENWKFKIESFDAIPREYLIPDEKKIGEMVRKYKNNTNIPGIKAFCEKTPIIRG